MWGMRIVISTGPREPQRHGSHRIRLRINHRQLHKLLSFCKAFGGILSVIMQCKLSESLLRPIISTSLVSSSLVSVSSLCFPSPLFRHGSKSGVSSMTVDLSGKRLVFQYYSVDVKLVRLLRLKSHNAVQDEDEARQLQEHKLGWLE